jgi:hypothetical protein
MKPWMQLRHVNWIKCDVIIQKRRDENHFISSIHWSNIGDQLITSAYDNKVVFPASKEKLKICLRLIT